MKRKSLILFITMLCSFSFVFGNSALERYLAKRKKVMFRRMRKYKLTPDVKRAFELVKRERFVFHRTNKRLARVNLRRVYEEMPLAIGYGQTISSPNMVAIMTNLVKPKKTDVVLEIGTGSGYQGAILAKLVKHVYSIEIVKKLGLNTKKVFKKWGYNNVSTKIADGYYGWKENAPYDKILVTCATNHIPPDLIRQLKPGGMMVIPVGQPYRVQQLIEVRKLANGRIKTKRLMRVQFVPMTGRAMRGR